MSELQANPSPQFAAALSTAAQVDRAIDEVCQSVAAKLQQPCDLAFVFFSADHRDAGEAIAAAIGDRLGTDCLLGCTAESVVGTAREIEMEPALSLWAASLPGCKLFPMHLTFESTPDGGSFLGWPDALLDGWPAESTLLLLGEPFSFPADVLLDRVNTERAGVPIIGGMASGGAAPGENRLIVGNRVVTNGAVGVLMSGGVQVTSVVSQGCRPIGEHFIITKAERNVIYQLGGKPAVLQANEIFQKLPTSERQLVQNGLHLGRVVSEYQDRFEQGDFLVRNVIGADAETGAIMITDYVRPGQTVQFQIRDASTADIELRQMLTHVRKQESTGTPAGALLFTCNGRGTRLFSEPHHDAVAVSNAFGDIPTAGFFAQGEIGPVGRKNFLHGFTASIALFHTKS